MAKFVFAAIKEGIGFNMYLRVNFDIRVSFHIRVSNGTRR